MGVNLLTGADKDPESIEYLLVKIPDMIQFLIKSEDIDIVRRDYPNNFLEEPLYLPTVIPISLALAHVFPRTQANWKIREISIKNLIMATIDYIKKKE